jgi:hypothetical protein
LGFFGFLGSCGAGLLVLLELEQELVLVLVLVLLPTLLTAIENPRCCL